MERNTYSFPQGYPVERDRWMQSSETCSACHKSLNMFTNKGNCGCCGRIFCSSCLTAELSFGPHTTPFQVCLDCFQKVQDHRRLQATQSAENQRAHADTSPPIDTHRSSSSEQGILERNIQILLQQSGELRSENEELIKVHNKDVQARESTQVLVTQLQDELRSLRAAKDDAERRAREVADALVEERDAFRGDRAAQSAEARRLEEALAVQKHSAQSSASEATAALAEKERELQALRERVKTLEASEVSCRETMQQAEEARRQAALEGERLAAEVRELERANTELGQNLDDARTSLRLLEERQAAESTAAAASGRWKRPSIVRDTNFDLPTVRVDPLPSAASFFEWGYDIVEAKSHVHSILQSVAAHVARSWSLFESEEELAAWTNCVALIENNYRDNYYHNATHAADVLQGLASLVTLCGDLFSQMTKIEKIAVAFAAIVHDVKHPARSQAFLKNIFDPVYLAYNGQSVLEQMHLATAFSLLAVPSADFTQHMSDSDALLFYSIVTSMVLKTDMAVHAACMEKAGAHTGSHPYALEKAADRLEVLSFILHSADIGATTKGVEVALKWRGITEEMYAQGDEERERGLPPSPGTDRNANLIRGQVFFIECFVFPTFDILHQLFSEADEPLVRLAQLLDYYHKEGGGEKKDLVSKSYIHRDEVMESTIAQLQQEYAELHQRAENDAVMSCLALKEVETQVYEVFSFCSRVTDGLHYVSKRISAADEKVQHVVKSCEQQKQLGLKDQQVALQKAMSHVREKAEALAVLQQNLAEREQRLQPQGMNDTYQDVLRDIKQQVSDIEERESRIALYSENLADIAHKMNYQKKQLSESKNSGRGKSSASFLSGPSTLAKDVRYLPNELGTGDEFQKHLSAALEHLISGLNR